MAKITRAILVLSVVAVFLLVGVLGPPHFGMKMTVDEHGHTTMIDCYMPGMTALCNMTALDHLTWWQNALASIGQQYASTLLLLILLAAIASAAVWVRQQYPPPRNSIKQCHLVTCSPLTLLQELFSSGVLHPKVF